MQNKHKNTTERGWTGATNTHSLCGYVTSEPKLENWLRWKSEQKIWTKNSFLDQKMDFRLKWGFRATICKKCICFLRFVFWATRASSTFMETWFIRFDSRLNFLTTIPNFWKKLCCRQSFTLNAGSKSEAYMWKTRNRKWPNLSEKISPVKICHFWVNIPYLRIWEIFPWNCAMIRARDFKLWSLTWVKLHWLTGRINEV